MYISYFDETGDDGYPRYSSKLFVLTSISLHHQNWKNIYQQLYDFRNSLKSRYGFPVKEELHTKHFLLNKEPYHSRYKFDEKTRLEIATEVAKLISGMPLIITNVGINKMKITSQNATLYKSILDCALKFNIQRIENTFARIDPGTKFLIITDEGRLKPMTSTTRKIQKINFIPSKFGPQTYRSEIKLLIEDPLPKRSSESYFIQLCDFVSFFVYVYLLDKHKIDSWNSRLSWLSMKNVEDLLTIMKPALNLQATQSDPYGVVVYPK